MKIYLRKSNGKFCNKNYYPNLGYGYGWIIILLALLAFSAYYSNSKPLISPLVIGPITKPVYAKETETISCEDVIGYIRCKFYSGEITEYQAKMLIAIGKAESGLRENARNKHSSARGVFQIVAGTWYSNNCVGDPMKFKDNTDCAIKIMKSSGFYPWDAFNRGIHKKFIKDIVI